MAKQNKNYQEQVAEAFKNRAQLIAEQIASSMGPPSNSQNLTKEQMLSMWHERAAFHPETGEPLDPEALFQQGMPIEQIVDLVYPYRSRMTKFGRPDPRQQVAFAEKMNRWSEGDDSEE